MVKVKKSKKLSLKQIRKRYNRRQKVVGIGIALMALLLLCVSILVFYPAVYNQIRKDRILGIYSSLNLSNISSDYDVPTRTNVFGDRRVYEWDSSRTYSSEEDFIRKADVNTTANELDKAIKAAGYTYFEERYPGSTEKTPTYKSANGEYIRVTVTSKTRDDAFFNNVTSDGKVPASVFDIDPNAAPSNVTIKVNLDDDNE
jgi:hypothetical protein